MADPTGDGGGGEKWSDNAYIFLMQRIRCWIRGRLWEIEMSESKRTFEISTRGTKGRTTTSWVGEVWEKEWVGAYRTDILNTLILKCLLNFQVKMLLQALGCMTLKFRKEIWAGGEMWDSSACWLNMTSWQLGESTSEVRHRVRRTEAERCLELSVLEPLHSLQIYSQPSLPFSVQFKANLCYSFALVCACTQATGGMRRVSAGGLVACRRK